MGSAPRQLWSLYEMLPFVSSEFAECVQGLETAARQIRGGSDQWATKIGLNYADTFLRHMLARVRRVTEPLPLSQAVRAMIERLDGRVSEGLLSTQEGRALALSLMEELEVSLIIESRSHLFLSIRSERRALFEQPRPPFGESVANKFPDANPDIAAGCRCFALDEWTASVFHLMRVVEHGLRNLADTVGHTFPTPVEYQEWGTILENIDAAIKRNVNALSKRTKEKSDESEFLSRAANQIYHFKDAWRNHVSHSRKTYDEREATRVYDSVKAFMQVLAERP